MKDLLSDIKNEILLYDGSKGVMLQMKGMAGDEASEEWNVKKPEEVTDIYKKYLDAGSDIIQSNTFPGNSSTLSSHSLNSRVKELVGAGIKLALDTAKDRALVAASIGPTGRFLEPAGDMTFEEAVNIFKESLVAIADEGCEIVNFETFTDLNEMRAAIIAARENTELKIMSSMSFEGVKTMSGNPASVCALVLKALKSDIVGANCSGGPESLIEPIHRMYETVGMPLMVKPNAGLPEMGSDNAVYPQDPMSFAKSAQEYIEYGVRLIGGCCGTTPDFIAALKEELKNIAVPPYIEKELSYISSAYTLLPVDFRNSYLTLFVEGEIQKAFAECDFDAFSDAVAELKNDGADAVIIEFPSPCDMPDMWKFMSGLCVNLRIPLIIKTESEELLQGFLRYYPGRAGVIPADKTLTDTAEKYGAYIF